MAREVRIRGSARLRELLEVRGIPVKQDLVADTFEK